MKNNIQWSHYLERSIEESILRIPYSQLIYNSIAPKYYEWKYHDISTEYKAPLTIFKRVQIDPSKIKYFTGRGYKLGAERRNNIGQIKMGNWDKKTKKPFHESEIYVGLRERFVEGRRWEETTLYNWAIDFLKNGRRWHNCSSEEDIRIRLDQIDNLYKRVKNHNYKTQRELHGSRMDFVNRYLNEVCIDIGRDGELLFVDGRHRLSIAKILELNRIPAFVLVRHGSWMEKRDAIYTGKIEYLYHPDIQELGSDESPDCA